MEKLNLPTVKLFGIDISCLEQKKIIDIVLNWAEEGKKSTISYVNAHCINISNLDKKYLKILQSMDIIYPDGISIVWGSKLLGGCKLQKMTGADWIYDFCQLAERIGISIYIIAGKPGVAKHACESLINEYPNLKILGIRDGYFSEFSEGNVIDDINHVSPDVVLVGMGVPNQEKWIDLHRTEISAPVCWGVGALFDYVAGIEPRVPPWMNKLGLEWLWRLIVDPLGKWKRYLIGNPIFILRILKEKLRTIYLYS